MATLVVLAGGCRVDGQPARVDAPAENEEGVPLRFAGPNDAALIVGVHINGQGPFDLVLDTGATFTCVTPAIAERLALPEQAGAIGFGAGVQAAGRVRIVRIDSLRVGTAAAHDMAACVVDLSAIEAVGAEVDGLLGLNFLRSFDVHLDFQARTLTLTVP